MQHLVIVGNGIAGVTTARHVRKLSNAKITIISAETAHFFSRTALMYIYMGHMEYKHTKPYEDHFWKMNNIELVREYVTGGDLNSKTLKLDGGRTVTYDKLVLATGSKSNKFGWPGQDLPGVQGLYSYQDLELLEENTKSIERAVIVGGGLIGIELAEMLLSRNIPVTFLIREEFYWNNVLPEGESRLVTNHVLEHGVDLRRSTNLVEILAGPDGRVRAITTDKGEEISCQLVGLTPGVHPNIDLANALGVPTNRGILVNDYLETEVPDVYSCGDCAEIKVPAGDRNRLEQLWYTGKMQGMALAQTLLGKRTIYERGHWYNSAKFMDIEYQTYGFVSAKPRDGEENFYWEHPDGKHCVRLVYKSSDREFVGLNTFGIRMRHKTFDRWLDEKRSVDYVLANLREANFDPEFYTWYEDDIIEAFNNQTGGTVKAAHKREGFLRRLFA